MINPISLFTLNYRSNKAKLILTIACLIVSAASITIHNRHQLQTSHYFSHQFDNRKQSHAQQNVYNQGEYLSKLANIQNTFKSNILDIQSDFVSINSMLNDTNLNDGQKKIKLQQALADERDSLRDIQNSLNVPYALKSCQCLDLNQQQKKDIQIKLDAVGQKINDLQKKQEQISKNCKDSDDCPLTTQLKQQINIMKNYQSIMGSTISSQCCKIVKRAYKDNLDTNNWHFGNMSEQEYQSQLFKRQQMEKTTLVPCSYVAPFTDTNNSCFSCPSAKPLFNLATRKCEKDCTQSSNNQAFVLNLTSHVCGYNKNCPINQYFDMTLLRCIITPNYYNDSSCPPEKPFWDPNSLSCSYCLAETPYYDVIQKKCRSCYQNQSWNQVKNACEGQVKCSVDQIYNPTTNTCTKKSSTGSHSLCPPNRPYWDEVNYSCDTCPKQKPYFDSARQYCRSCNINQSFNNDTSICQLKVNKICVNGEYYSGQTQKCQKTGTISMCPPSSPFWDSQSYKCLKCPSQTPFFNQKTRNCQSCQFNTTWSENQQNCLQQCALDQSWDTQNRKCLKKNRLCQPKFTFSINLNKCVQTKCTVDMPFWNAMPSNCQACPQYTIYNIQNNICQKDSRFGNVSVCQTDKPFWNAQILRCQPCPSGTSWNQLQNMCIKTTHHSHNYETSVTHEMQIGQNNKVYEHVYGNAKVSYQHRQLKVVFN